MKISDYMPELYINNIEMKNIINSEEIELEQKLKIFVDNVFKDNFIQTATLNGIQNYEKLLNIQLDENKDNLEYRRAIVKAKLATTVPLSYKWLENSLTSLVGTNNFEINLDNNTYTININIANLFENTAKNVYKLYRPLLPANLIIIVNLFEKETANLYFGGILHEGEKILVKSEVR